MKIDDAEFERIFRQYYARVWRFYRGSRISDDQAHDYAQDAFKRLYEKRHQLRGDEPWPFLQSIVRTVLLNNIRDQKAAKRSGRSVEIDAPEVAELAAPEEPDYAERQHWQLRRNELVAEKEQLPPGQREAMDLWLDGLKLDEIAQRLNISVDAVKSRLRDARRQLRARLGADALPEDEE
jgi:RNA polymerase sigma-70 factor (ECF subfamily)